MIALLLCSLAELDALVGEEESGESTGLVGDDGTSAVDVEVVPGLLEVGVEVGLGGRTGDLGVGSEDLGGEGTGTGLGEGEDTGGLAVDETTLGILIALLALDGVGGDDGSHEDVIGISRVSGGDDALIGAIGVGLPRLVGGAGLVELDGGLVLRLRVGRVLGIDGLVELLHGESGVGGSAVSRDEAEQGEDGESSHDNYYKLRTEGSYNHSDCIS